MNLVIQKRCGYEYVSFRESFWDKGRQKYTSRTVKNFGRLDVLRAQNPNILEELRQQAKESSESAASAKTELLKQRISAVENKSANPDAYGDNEIAMMGACVYKQIWDKLHMPRKLRDIQNAEKFEFDFPGIIFYLTAARSILPDSKFTQWDKRNRYFLGPKSSRVEHFYKSLDRLIAKKDDIIRYVNRQIAKIYKRKVTVALYDVTTYAFESQVQDSLRNYGFSKDCKINNVQVVMGLLIDDKGIPIDYELYPGNTSEFGTMVPILQKLKKEYNIEKVVVTADRGLNSNGNLMAIKELGFEYVIAYRLRKAGKDVKEALKEKDKTWTSRSSKAANVDVSKYHIMDESRIVRRKNAEGEWEKITLESKLLLNYSDKRKRKDAHDRDRSIQKANRYVENPALLKSDMKKGGKSLLKFEGGDELKPTLDKEKIEEAAAFDGFYGIIYSDPNMSAEDVLKTHHSLWQIEQSFRISKSLLEARPCFHWTEKRIRAHFLICFLSLIMHRLLEVELKQKGHEISAEAIVEALSQAALLKIDLDGVQTAYCKTDTKGDFETIASAVGLEVDKLPRIASANDVRKALKLKEL